jgi:hypothetical protein
MNFIEGALRRRNERVEFTAEGVTLAVGGDEIDPATGARLDGGAVPVVLGVRPQAVHELTDAAAVDAARDQQALLEVRVGMAEPLGEQTDLHATTAVGHPDGLPPAVPPGPDGRARRAPARDRPSAAVRARPVRACDRARITARGRVRPRGLPTLTARRPSPRSPDARVPERVPVGRRLVGLPGRGRHRHRRAHAERLGRLLRSPGLRQRRVLRRESAPAIPTTASRRTPP